MKNRYIEAYTNENAFKFDKERAVELIIDFDLRATVEDGVVRWNSNGNIPPSDILEFWKFLGKDFDYDKTIKVNEEETKKFFEEYRKNMQRRNPSEEELFEMRAAFGEGAEVVDVISGRRIKL